MKKKLLTFIGFLLMGLFAAFAQVPANQQLSYQAVIRNASNQLLISQNNISVTVNIKCDGTLVYSEEHTGLQTNENGLITFYIGSVAPTTGTWEGINWAIASIQTVTTWSDGTVTSDYMPVAAVPFALYAGNVQVQEQADWNETDNTSAAFIQNKPDLTVYATNAHLNDTLSHYPTINDLKDTATNVRSALVDTAAAIRADFPTVNNGTFTITYGSETPVTFTANQDGNSEITIPAPAAPNNGAITVTRNGADVTNGTFTVDQNTNQTIDIAVPTTVAELTDAADYAKVAADNSFTGTNTVPSGFDMETTTVANCGNVVVNACDLLAVFDSLNRRISALEDALDALMHAVPPTVLPTA